MKKIFLINIILLLILSLPIAKAYRYTNCTEWIDSFSAHCQGITGTHPEQECAGNYDLCHTFGGGMFGTANTTCFPYCYGYSGGDPNLAKIKFWVAGTLQSGYDGNYNVSVCGVNMIFQYSYTAFGSPSIPANCWIDMSPPAGYPPYSAYSNYYVACNVSIPPSCNPQTGYNISLIRTSSWGGIGTHFGFSNITLDCYGSENWINSVCPTPHYIPPTSTESNSCDNLYLITDRGVLPFLESILNFVVNFIICLSPMYILIFGVAIAGILLLAMKRAIR